MVDRVRRALTFRGGARAQHSGRRGRRRRSGPAHLTPRPGSFALGATTSIVAGDDVRVQAELLRDQLRPATGLPLSIVPSETGSRIVLTLDADVGRLGDEGYRLTVGPDQIAIRASKPAGILHASQTL